MRTVKIDKLLAEHDIDIKKVSLGDFDYIGEFSAKKNRQRTSDLFHSVGCFFRPNYERGILIYSLIKRYNLQSYLEIGFGRGYSAICAAKALCDIGSSAKVVTIDPSIDEKHLQILSQTIPGEWLEKIQFVKGTSQEMLPQILAEHKFDFVYIDGDHRAPAVKSDWEMVKDSWNHFCLFDDYHLPTKNEADIECARVIDEISPPEHVSKDLIIMDRRVFFDDRRLSDEEVDYGQVLLTNKSELSKQDEW